MSLRVCLYNEPILRKKGAQISDFDSDLEALSKDMVETMYEYDGIGLAAQQVGRDLMLCVVDVPQTLESAFQIILDGKSTPPELVMPMALVNPVIELLTSVETTYEEGCLSFPGINGNVRRPDQVRVNFQDEQGSPHTLECNGLLSRCIQHEVDHINGILFIDRMDRDSLKTVASQILKLKKQTQKSILQERKNYRSGSNQR
ncbi:MAG: peptide deformylase [Opitutaceae bacterium]|nr:peptide deformylase [Opitutaceae bacterium]